MFVLRFINSESFRWFFTQEKSLAAENFWHGQPWILAEPFMKKVDELNQLLKGNLASLLKNEMSKRNCDGRANKSSIPKVPYGPRVGPLYSPNHTNLLQLKVI